MKTNSKSEAAVYNIKKKEKDNFVNDNCLKALAIQIKAFQTFSPDFLSVSTYKAVTLHSWLLLSCTCFCKGSERKRK